MTPRTFTILGLVAAGSLAAAAIVHANANSWLERMPGGAKLFAGLPRAADSVSTVAVRRGEDKLTLARSGEVWVVKDKDSYPAQGDRVRQLMVRLVNAELIEPKTRNPDRFDVLDLGDPAKTGTNATLISLADAKGGAVAEVIVGKRAAEQLGSGKTGTYVRRPGETQAWLTDTDLSAATALTSWVDSIVLELDTAKISKLEVTLPGEPPIVVEKSGVDSKLVGIPEGQKVKIDSTPGFMVEAFSRLDLEDVRKAPANAPAPVQTATVTAQNGMTVRLDVRPEGDAKWIAIAAAGDGDAKDDVAKINARAGGWQYKIASWKLDQIFKSRADLLEPVAAPGGAAPDAPAAPN